MRHDARGDERVADEQPARAGLHRNLHLTARETLPPALDGRRHGIDPTPAYLTAPNLERVDGDLPPVHVKPSDDRHRGLP